MDINTARGEEISKWFEIFLKIVCWEFGLEPKFPYHDLANTVVELLEDERNQAKNLPWRSNRKEEEV